VVIKLKKADYIARFGLNAWCSLLITFGRLLFAIKAVGLYYVCFRI
jgi:hypothetical protein